MLRAFTGVQALVAIALALPTRAEDEQATGFTMQLHRMPRLNRQPARYARRLGVEEDGPELVPLHLGLGYVTDLSVCLSVCLSAFGYVLFVCLS